MDTLTDRERQKLDDDGYLDLGIMVDRKSLAAMRVRLDALLEATEQSHAGTLIVNGLVDEPVFDVAWNQPRVLAAVAHILGDRPRLLGVFSRGLRPGHGQQALHADWGGQGVPGVWYSCHVICALSDFTQENGATRVVPGTQRNPAFLRSRFDPRKPHPQERQLIGSAGSVFILNVHCAHSAVHNASKEPRLAIFANFSRRDSPLLALNPHPSPKPETLARFQPEIQALLAE